MKQDGEEAVIDAGLILAAQKVEHYEIRGAQTSESETRSVWSTKPTGKIATQISVTDSKKGGRRSHGRASAAI
jgi:hypothetical protein